MSIYIRQAQPGDEAAVVALIRELGEASGFPSPVDEGHVRAFLEAPGCCVLLAEEGAPGSVPAGLLSFSVRPGLFHAAPSAAIEELVVRGPARGRGVGSALMAEFLRRAEDVGCAEVSVSAMPDNEAALRLYRAHGLVDEAVFLEKHLL